MGIFSKRRMRIRKLCGDKMKSHEARVREK